MATPSLWLRWSWRDLRRRWPLVSAIALVIALGTGTYASLMSTSAWRTASNDASFALLHTHDLRVALSQGVSAAEGELDAAVRALPAAAQIASVRERLLLPTQIAGPDGLLVPGEVVGSALAETDPVDDVSIDTGRPLASRDDGTPTVVVETSFARAHRLPSEGELTLTGNRAVRYVGQGQSPEHFLVSGEQVALPFADQTSYGVLFATLHTAQLLADAPGRVNDVVLVLKPSADRDLVQRQLEDAVASGTSPLSGVVTTRDEMRSYRILYDDISSDAKLWRVLALLILGGAAVAALNLTTRVVEAQRREIGVGMALGLRTRQLVVRPLLFGAQVALIGAVLGVGVGLLVGAGLRQVFLTMLPLPVWQTDFQAGVYARAAALGFGVPLVAVVWPVRRAVRVEPVEAIRVGHLAARDRGASQLLRRVRLPGRTWQQVPLRNVLRTPRRTLLTTLGVAAAITTLVTTIGFIDTFEGTYDRAGDELLRVEADRVSVGLSGFRPVDGGLVAQVAALPQTGEVSAALLLPTTARTGSAEVDLVTQTLPSDALWTPQLTAGEPDGGLLLAQKAADDLGVRVGDTVTLEHPRAAADGTVRTGTTDVVVAGIHPNPMRPLAYLGADHADVFGLERMANLLVVTPAAGATSEEVRRALLGVPGVGSAEGVRTTTDGMRRSLEEFTGVLRIGSLVTLLLALLIAFNTASIGVDERAREHATMLAFGLPLRSVLGMTVAETALVGVLGTVLGIAGGYAVLAWMTAVTIPSVFPELAVTPLLHPSTVAAALALGVGTVALAPVLTFRRTGRLDIPATLRVVE